jgi:DNA-binding NarL/FixJ family response regulator
MRGVLESYKFEVCGEASDGMDGIEKAKELRPDLILLDLSMPRMDGAKAASLLKRIMPSVPIILFTMYEDNLAPSWVSAHVDCILSKPHGVSDLIQRIRGLSAHRN